MFKKHLLAVVARKRFPIDVLEFLNQNNEADKNSIAAKGVKKVCEQFLWVFSRLKNNKKKISSPHVIVSVEFFWIIKPVHTCIYAHLLFQINDNVF